MKIMKYSKIFLLSGIIILTMPIISFAQTTIEEIIVTAAKREQNLQDVSISLTALSGDMIDAFGYENNLDIAAQAPNVYSDQNSYSGGIKIRGNSTSNPSLAGEGNVALYFDDVYRPTAYYPGNQLLDTGRAEILRGPQGTLFGRNAVSGLLHIISRKPTDEFEGYARLEFGSYGTRIFEGAVSGTVNDGVRGRLAIKTHEDDGYQDNLGPAGSKHGVTDHFAVRGHLEFDLNEDATLLLTLETSDADDVGKAFNYWGLIDPTTLAQCEAERVRAGECVGGGAYFGLPTFAPGPQDVTKVYTEHDPANGQGLYTMKTKTAIAKLTWKLSETTELISITAYDHQDRFFNTDEDASVAGLYGGYFSYDDHYTSGWSQKTQELRFSGVNENGVDFLLGFYYLDTERDATSTITDFAYIQIPDTISDVYATSWAVFGQFGKSLSDTLKFIGGLRYNEEDKELDILTAGNSGHNEMSESNVSYKLGLEYRPRDDFMVFGTIGTAFRSGNFNTDLLFGDVSKIAPVDTEGVVSYEIGFKSTSEDGRRRVNAAIFYLDVSDKQGTIYEASTDSPTARLIKLGDAEIQGLEVEISLVPTENLMLNLGVGWMHSKVINKDGYYYSANFGTGANAFGGDKFYIDGSPLGGPQMSINGMVAYQRDNVTFQADFDWRKDAVGSGGNDITYTEDRTLVNLRVFWDLPSEGWELEAFVENAFDEEYIDGMYALAGSDYAYGNMGMPRWFGVKIGREF